jgi:hypothetical protein
MQVKIAVILLIGIQNVCRRKARKGIPTIRGQLLLILWFVILIIVLIIFDPVCRLQCRCFDPFSGPASLCRGNRQARTIGRGTYVRSAERSAIEKFSAGDGDLGSATESALLHLTTR